MEHGPCTAVVRVSVGVHRPVSLALPRRPLIQLLSGSRFVVGCGGAGIGHLHFRPAQCTPAVGGYCLFRAGGFLVASGQNDALNVPRAERYGRMDFRHPRPDCMGLPRLGCRIRTGTCGRGIRVGLAVRRADAGCGCLDAVQRLGGHENLSQHPRLRRPRKH